MIAGLPGLSYLSPDGKWVAHVESGPAVRLTLYDAAGIPVRTAELPGGPWAWLPDSSGLFIALDAPQRASTLGVLELDGRITKTDVQLSHQTLSRNGRWIVAEQQDGCCMQISITDLRVSPRTGGQSTTLVHTSVGLFIQPIALLGVDATDRVVYRDVHDIKRVSIGGGTPTTLATALSFERLTAWSTSPDGAAILARGDQPGSLQIIAGDGVRAWDESAGRILQLPGPADFFPPPLWVGPHHVLVRDAIGKTTTFDLVTRTSTTLAAELTANDMPLAYAAPRLLVSRGGLAVVIDTTTGSVRETGVDLRPDEHLAWAAPRAGGFFLSGYRATYAID